MLLVGGAVGTINGDHPVPRCAQLGGHLPLAEWRDLVGQCRGMADTSRHPFRRTCVAGEHNSTLDRDSKNHGLQCPHVGVVLS